MKKKCEEWIDDSHFILRDRIGTRERLLAKTVLVQKSREHNKNKKNINVCRTFLKRIKCFAGKYLSGFLLNVFQCFISHKNR